MVDEVGKLFDLEAYLDRAEKDYLLDGREEFQFSLRFSRRVKADHDRFEKEIRAFDSLRLNYGRTARSGHVRVGRISDIAFAAEDLLRLRPELRAVRQGFQDALSIASRSVMNIDVVRTYMRTNYAMCRRKYGVLSDCVEVLDYLLTHRETVRGKYCRQIPHGKSTKLIGREAMLLGLYEAVLRQRGEHSANDQQDSKTQWTDFISDFDLRTKPLSFLVWASRLRIDGCSIEDFDGLLNEENVARFHFEDVDFAIIVENEETFYSLRLALRHFPTPALLIAGGGAAVSGAGFLAGALGSRPQFYWGDMDASGYEIFHGARSLFPALQPMLMNRASLDRYASLAQRVTPTKPRAATVPLLDSEYRRVCRDGVRIEQEHLPIEDMIGTLKEALSR
jgi:hypothetical protein